MSKKVLVPIADGTEEIEAACIIDTLRRADTDVTVASIHTYKQVTASSGLKITADCLIDECKDSTYDLIALPGGMPGAEHLSRCQLLITMLKRQKTANRLYAAICASPAVVLAPHGLLDDVKATCYPSMLDKLNSPSKDKVVVDQNCITSQGPATAILFAIKLLELLYDKQIADKIAKAMLI
ncbi:MAG: DJ-1/PfpI family protein [Phycisphaerae bacterium]|nr:DJ-1/PfpI family protein [Phycisphaerae bacterium]